MDSHDQDRHAIFASEADIDVDKFRAEDGAHVVVEMGDVDAGRIGRFDLRPQLRLDRLGVGVAAELGRRCARRSRRRR